VWLLDVLVQPRAACTEVDGLHDGRLRLRLTAPPVDGAANAMVAEVLAARLALPRGAISIVRGQSGRRKTVSIRGGDELAARLSHLAGQPA
jgi:uncharacterized protein (TIGR00251 family)